MSHYGEPHHDSLADYPAGHVANAVWRTLLWEDFGGPRFVALILSFGCLAAGVSWSIAAIAGETHWLAALVFLVGGAAATWLWTRNFKALVLERLRREHPLGR